jgi:hypothetical protein
MLCLRHRACEISKGCAVVVRLINSSTKTGLDSNRRAVRGENTFGNVPKNFDRIENALAQLGVL